MKEKIMKLKELVMKSKKNLALTIGGCVLVLGLAGGGVVYAVQAGNTAEPVTQETKNETKKEVKKETKKETPVVTPKEETKKTDVSLKKEDITAVVTGLEDHYILQNAKDIDYLYNVKYEKDIVKTVTADAKGVDLSKPGTYKAVYHVTVHPEELTSYLDEKAKKEAKAKTSDTKTPEATTTKEEKVPDAAKDKANTTKDTSNKENISKENTSEVKVDTTITVVDKKTAMDLVSKDKVVWTDKNEVVPKNEKAVEKDPTKKAEPTSTKPSAEGNSANKNGSTANAGTTNKAPSANTGNGNSGNSGATTKPSGNTGSGNSGNQSNNSGESNSGENSNNSGNSNSGGNSNEEEHVAPPEPTVPEPTVPEPTVPEPTVPEHTHDWQPVTQTVNHEATGHYEDTWVQDSEAWEEPVYDFRCICNKCGIDCEDNPGLHSAQCGGGYGYKYVQTGSITHEATGHNEQSWVEDSAAWSEDVTTGYTCSCGAAK